MRILEASTGWSIIQDDRYKIRNRYMVRLSSSMRCQNTISLPDVPRLYSKLSNCMNCLRSIATIPFIKVTLRRIPVIGRLLMI
ncbi:hypothetical protein D3C77_571420 [compost metagenome]